MRQKKTKIWNRKEGKQKIGVIDAHLLKQFDENCLTYGGGAATRLKELYTIAGKGSYKNQILKEKLTSEKAHLLTRNNY